MHSLRQLTQQTTALGYGKRLSQRGTLQRTVHARPKAACAAVHSSSRQTQRKNAALSAANRKVPALSPCGLISSPTSRNVLCRYLSDGAGDPPRSGPEAAAFNELSADAASQAATQQLQSAEATATRNGSVDESHSSPVQAASKDDESTDPTSLSRDNNQRQNGHGSSSTSTSNGNGNGKGHKTSSDDHGPLPKLQERLSEMTSQYDVLGDRLDSLEHTLVRLLSNIKERSKRPARTAGVGPGSGAAASDGNGAASDNEANEDDISDYDDFDEGGMFNFKKIQASLSENINQGYLESVKHMRDMLMAYEWHLHGKELAERQGVAEFEKHCAMNDIDIDFDVLTALYKNPHHLTILSSNKLKLLARSIIQQAVDERYCSIYWECTTTAKELAKTGLKDVIPDSAGKVGGVLKGFLPIPGFLKK